MAHVVTLTMNPSIDLSVSLERVLPFHKLRCAEGRRDPGGGGINVARVMKRLGADVTAIYAAGGTLGQLLRELIDEEGIPASSIRISGETREDFTVLERSTGAQYRFVLPGPHFADREWRTCLDVTAALDSGTRFIVASGSLPPGVPYDFYGRVAKLAKQGLKGIVIDSSGPALGAAIQAGVYLIKPSLNELRGLMGSDVPLETQADWIEACRRLVDRRQVEVVALTLGDRGALLVTRDRVLRASALAIKPVSIVGAGDSFLGAMIWSLAAGHELETAFRYGVAAGSAALLMPGTELCRREDVERLIKDVTVETI
jgi:6-phosphofructokinase 2